MKKKSIVSYQRPLLLFLFVILCLTVKANYFFSEHLGYKVVSDTEVELDYYGIVNNSNVTIPSVAIFTNYDNYNSATGEYEKRSFKVISIAPSTFRYHGEIVSISIPNSIKSIGSNAFEFCSNLNSVSIPNSVETIGRGAFLNCRSLASISIPSSVSIIEGGTFSGCSSLTSISLPNSILSIGGSAFKDCTSLTSIILPNSILSIGGSAFEGCTSLTSIILPDSVTSIGLGAFKGCSSLTSINIPKSLTVISWSLFQDCSGLSSISIPNSVTSIESSAFKRCTSLTSIIIPKSVKSIEEAAFEGCIGLRLISIPNSIESLGWNTFKKCDNVDSIYIDSPHYLTRAIKEAHDLSNIKKVELGSHITEIPQRTFHSYSNLTSVKLSNSVKSIGSSAFSDCVSLTSISIPQSVVSIGSSAFYKCTSLDSISIPTSITSIENSVFKSCSHLRYVSLPNSVTIIKNDAFNGCTSLEKILLPEYLESLGKWAFNDCSSLTEIIIPDSVRSIGSFAFSGCNSIRSVTIGANTDSIGASFDECESLEKVYCKAQTPPNFKSLNTFPYYKDKKGYHYYAMLFVHLESIDMYKSHNMWNKFKIASLMDVKPNEGFAVSEYWDEDKDAKGVTADGLSKIDISQTKQPNSEALNFKDIKIKFELDGKECTDEKITGKCGEIEWKDIDVWGFTYTAPEDFPEKIKGNEYTLDITLESEEKGLVAVLGAAKIKVLRPGVLLVHGLNSNGDCFGSVKNYLTSIGGYERYQICNVNYSATNKVSFERNSNKNGVIGSNARKLFKKLADKGIVSSSYDIVGHSMGGILARKYAQEVDYKSVNRIITINTPHSGSEWATTYNHIATVASLSTYALGLPVLDRVIKLIADYNKARGNWGAIQDLDPNSQAIAFLNRSDMLSKAHDIPVHAICSTMDMSDVISQTELIEMEPADFFSIYAIAAFFGKRMVNSITDVSILGMLFGKDSHDGVVSYTSQRGGLGGGALSLFEAPYKGLFGSSSLAHHCNVTQYSRTAIEISRLLHESKSSSFFAKGFHPADLSKAREMTRSSEEMVNFKEPSESQFIKIQAEHDDTARVLKVSVTGSNDLWANLVFIGLDEDNLLTGIGQNEYRFRIPDTYEGDLTVYALGRTDDDALVGDSVVVSYEKGATLSYMFFEDWPEITMVEGQQIELNVIGGWSNGEESYILPEYSTNKEGIIESDGSLITAKAEGECLLIATYDGLADTITVKVVAANANSISTLERNMPSIRYSNGNLEVIPIKGYSGPVNVMIYDTSGNVCYQQHRIVSVLANEPIEFDLSSLSTQLYIARVRTSYEHAIKFVKK